MSLTPFEQFKKFLENSKEVLILIPENPSADAVGASWALYWFLEKKNICPTLAFSNHLSPKFGFLPKPQRILQEISGARDFVLSFDTERNKIKHIRHEEKDGKFNIFITPEKGAVDPRDFSFILAKFKYDLIVVVGSPDLEKLGKIYSDNTDLFFEVPVANIDHGSDNDNFGQINLVNITASSSSEITAELLENVDKEAVDKNIATCLLAGLIGATESFQKKNTTPKALSLAAGLMDLGADQQEIIRWLYKTQPLNILKLWGRAMAKINWDEKSQLVWSAITLQDFVESRSNPEDLKIIIEKLEENYSDGKIFMAVYNDTPDSTVALIKTAGMETAKKVYPQLDGAIFRGMLEIKIARADLDEVGKAIAERIKKIVAGN
jgi:nanoRNase/pAp phosphatase (c-di-AMP/oligoRNAs hydrolase)